MINLKCPCKDCQFRTAECHASCESYAEYARDYRIKNAELNKMKAEEGRLYRASLPKKRKNKDLYSK